MNYFSKTRPQAGKKEVLETAYRLMQEHGETTTLEVKVDLRDQGYIALQGEVSHWMAELSTEYEWPFSFNGKYRIYMLEALPEWLVELTDVCLN